MFVVGSPATTLTPAGPTAEWPGIGISLIGWDGVEWDFNDPTSGVSLMAGVRGLDDPPDELQVGESDAVPGEQYRDQHTSARPCFLPIEVFSDGGSQAMFEHMGRFRRSALNRHKPSMWRVVHPDGVTQRLLTVRYVSDGDRTHDIDPTLTGRDRFGAYMRALWPFWQGTPIVAHWPGAAPVDFFDTANARNYISPSSDLTTASINNPGDENTTITWWVGAGGAGSPVVELGVGGKSVNIPFEIAVGKLLVVDGAPTARWAKLIDAPPLVGGQPQGDAAQVAWVDAQLPTATLKTKDLGSTTRWGELAPGEPSPLTITRTNSTSDITARITPQYASALY